MARHGALCVPDEEDSLAALLEEEAEAAVRVVRKAVGVDLREEGRCGAREGLLGRLSRNHSFVWLDAASEGCSQASQTQTCTAARPLVIPG